ncbi:MAG: HAD-IA family hydrolase [Oscillospiraceae bacterium]|nr:HAD-IA family hydrolase [Oscillospiraceae bacterium]
MKKNDAPGLAQYKAIILDMDGTLYFQTPVRFFTALSLVAGFLSRKIKYKDIKILAAYRKLRESRAFAENEDFAQKQLQSVADTYSVTPAHVKNIIDCRMHEKPLKYVRLFRDKSLVGLINSLRSDNTKIIIYSDYPAKDKARAIGIDADLIFYSESKEIMCMKPDPRGLINILNIAKAAPREALYVGDRYSKDGLCAKAAGVRYINLGKYLITRRFASRRGFV